MNTRTTFRGSCLLAMASFGAACSSVPPAANTALDQARERYDAGQRDSKVTSLAADEFQQVGRSSSAANEAWQSREPDAKVDHQASMTLQDVVVAQETASDRAARAVTAQSDAAAAAANRQKERKDARVGALEEELVALNAKRTDRGMVLTLGDVLFDTGQAQIRADGARNMQKLAEFLKRFPEARVSIEGHTDTVGSAQSNYALSQRRADSVRSALTSLGVPPDSLSTRAHGPDIPIATNDTAAGRRTNRRVEIVFQNVDAEF